MEVTGQAALRPGHVLPGPAAARAAGVDRRAAAPARAQARLRRAGGPGRTRRSTTVTETARYGTATATAWARLHQRLAHRAGWEDHEGELPVIEGTLIRLAGRSPARPARRGPGMAVVLPRRRHRRGGEPDLAGVPAPLRYRAHVPVPQAGTSAGPARSSATRPPPTAGPGSSSPPTPSCTSPATSPPTSGCPGSSRARPAASPRPGSAGGFAASARTCPFPPARRNPPGPDPDARQGRRTSGPPPATTSAKPSSAKRPKKKTRRQVK